MGGSVGGIINDVVDNINTAFSDIEKATKWVQNQFEDISKPLTDTANFLHLDAITKTISEYWYYSSGQENRDRQQLQDYKNRLEGISSNISSIQSDLSHKRFMEDIFKYSDQRNMKYNIDVYTKLAKEAQDLLNKYNSKTRQADTFLEQVMLFVPKVSSAVAFSTVNFLETGNLEELGKAVEIILLVVAIVISIMSIVGAPPSASWTWKIMIELFAALMTILASTMALDAIVNNSGLLKASFKILDVIANDILGLDNYIDTGGVSSDSEYYDGNLAYTRMIAGIVALISSVGASFNNYYFYHEGTTTLQQQATAELFSTSNNLATMTLSELNDYYNLAMDANNVAEALRAKGKLEEKLKEYKDSLEKQQARQREDMEYAMDRDVAYILNDADRVFNNYEIQLSEAGATDVFDPEGTIAMNTRYQVQPSYMFGFENMFNYNSMAGGSDYVYHTLWASKRNEI